MISFQKSGKWRKITQSKFFLVFLGLVIAAFVYNLIGLSKKMEETIKNKKIVEDKITELGNSKDKLSSDISKLKTNEGVEANIREKFGLAKEGEGMVVIVDDKNSDNPPKIPNSSGFFSFLKNLFK